MTAGQVSDSLVSARQHAPEMQDPLAEARVEVVAGRLELCFEGQRMDAMTGQLHLPLEPAAGLTSPRDLTPAAARQASRHAEAEQWFAFALTLEGEPELRAQVAAAYEQCLQLDPGFTSARINLGTLRYQEKDFAAAETWYRSARDLDPNYALAHFNLGNVFDETGRLAEAAAAYEAAIKLVPDYADAHYNLALAYQRLGQPRRAIPHWQQYLGLDHASAWADHARGQLKQALARDNLKLVARVGSAG